MSGAMRGLVRNLTAAVLGLVAGVLVLMVASAAGWTTRTPARYRLVAEDASAPLRTIAIHYAPAADEVALPVWRQLFAVLPARVDVEVAVAAAPDFDRFVGLMAKAGVAHRERFHPVVVGHELTTWSRDRFAALVGPDGEGGVLAPPAVETAFGGRAGDMLAPHAIARAVWGGPARTSKVVFEGGDLAASSHTLFVGAEVMRRSRGRGASDRQTIDRELRRQFGEPIVWLGDEPGDVPHHHVMMFMVPLDDHTVLVGDPRAGAAMAAREPAAAGLALDDDLDGDARRFERVAELLAARGYRVLRVPVVVLAGAGSYVTYTNALFDREPGPGGRPIVYLPTYGLPSLDEAAAAQYASLGYIVHPIDVSGIYQLNGSIGCLVNVMARA
ncbi:MAG TPA: agmatine deiminase family protein [Kofleriaceae bacterium]|nr:agmatine deiminase family protein [Kofleriaceae bacterium]